MRLFIEHETVYEFEEPSNHSIQYLRLSPRRGLNQYVSGWSMHSSGHLARFTDGLGNDCHTAVQEGAHSEVSIVVEGMVETMDTIGILPSDDGLHPLMFLRETDYTKVDESIHDFAMPFTAQLAAEGTLNTMHSLMAGIGKKVSYEQGITNVESTAAEVLAEGAGVCQDHAHLFIACCRVLGLPARYVSGYMFSGDASDGQLASHAWAETLVDDLGWVSFDPSNQQSATEAYVRLAIGFDYDTACPVRGIRRGGGSESLHVRVQVSDNGQSQSQNQ